MVLVDVIVPSVNKVYDFQLSETALISTVIEEICEMISQKERVSIVGNVTELLLCDKDTNSILENNKTLAECNVVTGHSLIFI
ncbi:MAG: glutamyl-tRNA amidotransferase [Lachnospiraceae bacterium]|nr:glutamyl-tRNA amidotransferase [Lachnospiraceae bacterium]